ncbi:multidrug effflux MFS transporter [Microbacterium terregens]|uniref:Multidrug effflux MFS transporter n=1 Tax=Microbacterium terregens TaxID=69363 RepID=A0ABV5SVI4_9MICO
MTSPAPRAKGDYRLGGGLLAALGYVSMAGSLSTDLYLPSFPSIAQDLGVGASAVQLTLTAFLAGSAVGQLFIGALSDALGRRRVLIAALALFTVCGFAAAASPTLAVLIGVRAVQGFAGAAGAVLARAVVADLVSGERAVRAFSTLFIMIALGPTIASPLGALLTGVGGWRLALLGLAVFATGMLVVAILFIPESMPPDERHPLRVGALARNVGRLVRNPTYISYAIAYASGYAALMVYISSSSFIVQGVLDVTPFGYALTFSLSSIAVMLGAWSSGRIARARGATTTMRVGQVVTLLGASATALFASTGTLVLGTYLPSVFAVAVGCGIVMSSASALAIGHAVAAAGAGSALLGFLQFLFGALASPLGGTLGTDTAVPAGVSMTAFALTGLAAGFVATRRRTAA